MLGVIWEILPIALGVVASPVAVLALLGIMLSDDPRHNAVAYTLGWVTSVTVSLLVWTALFVRIPLLLSAALVRRREGNEKEAHRLCELALERIVEDQQLRSRAFAAANSASVSTPEACRSASLLSSAVRSTAGAAAGAGAGAATGAGWAIDS